MFIITVLVFDVQQNINAAQCTDSQTNDIDKAEGLIF